MTRASSSASSPLRHLVGSKAQLTRRPEARERLLIAAEAVWSERGYGSTRVEDLLVAADVSRATFYQHFKGKEDVAAGLLNRAIGLLLRTAAERSHVARGFAEKVAAGLDAYLELWQRHGRIVQELSVEALRPGSQLGPVRKRVVDLAVEAVGAEFFAQRRRRMDPLAVRHLILGVEALLMHASLDGDGPLDDAARAELHAATLALILRAASAKPG